MRVCRERKQDVCEIERDCMTRREKAEEDEAEQRLTGTEDKSTHPCDKHPAFLKLFARHFLIVMFRSYFNTPFRMNTALNISDGVTWTCL